MGCLERRCNADVYDMEVDFEKKNDLGVSRHHSNPIRVGYLSDNQGYGESGIGSDYGCRSDRPRDYR